jgi:homospermidine synthase
VEERSRETADGSTLRWRLAGMDQAMQSGALPFFVQWDVPEDERPAAARARHDADPRGIAWVEVTGEDERVREWLGDDADLPVRVTEGDPAIVAAAVETGGGEIVLR